MPAVASHDEVLAFWFGRPDAPDYGQPRKAWFVKDPAFDETIRARFLSTWEAAAGGQLDAWAAEPYAALARVVVLDQFPRNIFRNGARASVFRDPARAFSSDAAALAAARSMLAAGQDQALLPVERAFVYLPLEHAEDMAMQREAVARFTRLVAETPPQGPDLSDMLDYARRHAAVIERFGRFPHRNAVLGRATTPAEEEFLSQPGSRF